MAPIQNPSGEQTIRIEIVHHLLAPAELVCGTWIQQNPLPGYKCAAKSMRFRIGKKDSWTLQLFPTCAGAKETLVNPMTHEAKIDGPPHPPIPCGAVIFRAVRPHICRLTINLEFPTPADEASQWAIADMVSDFDTRLNQFADNVISNAERTGDFQRTIFS